MRSMFHTAAAVHDTGCQLMQTGRLFQGGNEYPHVGCVHTKVMGPKGDLPSHGPAAAPDRQHRRHGISVTPIVPGLMRTGSHIRQVQRQSRKRISLVQPRGFAFRGFHERHSRGLSHCEGGKGAQGAIYFPLERALGG